jgi:hypothetical protein
MTRIRLGGPRLTRLTGGRAGLALALLQGSLLLGLGGVMQAERALLPRGWVRSDAYDPELPIRGRYISLQLLVPAVQLAPASGSEGSDADVQLRVQGNRLEAIVVPEDQAGSTKAIPAQIEQVDGAMVARLAEPVAVFIPADAADPSRPAGGQELWVEVSLVKEGPPRPIQLGIRRPGQARIEPLQFHRPAT